MTAARLSGQVVLISGAASGIGAAIAARCIAEGAKVICADLRGEAARALGGRLGAAALGIACDVADLGSAEAAVASARQHFGRLDGLVHNAAAPSRAGTVTDLDPEAWNAEIAVSLTGAFYLANSAVPPWQPAAVARSCSSARNSRASPRHGGGLLRRQGRARPSRQGDGARPRAGAHPRQQPVARRCRTSRLLRRFPDFDAANAALGPAHLLGRIAEPDEIAAAAAFLLSATPRS